MDSKPIKQRLKQRLWDASPAAFQRLTAPHRGQRFSIGIFTGDSPLSLAAPAGVQNPVLTCADVDDIPAAFVADPFMIRNQQRWYMFFEVLSKIVHRGVIALATSVDARDWRYEGVVLTEPFHLAYPSVIASGQSFYLIPDTPSEGVLLYKAGQFPREWQSLGKIIDGKFFSDSSVFRYDETWWMLTAWAPTQSAPKSLRLFSSEELTGPWREHPGSPVVSNDDHISRPAGSVRMVDDRLVRFTQDTASCYGSMVRAYEILELSPTQYREREMGRVLSGGDASWNAGGMHHLDAHRLHDGSWIACVDGWMQTPDN